MTHNRGAATTSTSQKGNSSETLRSIVISITAMPSPVTVPRASQPSAFSFMPTPASTRDLLNSRFAYVSSPAPATRLHSYRRHGKTRPQTRSRCIEDPRFADQSNSVGHTGNWPRNLRDWYQQGLLQPFRAHVVVCDNAIARCASTDMAGRFQAKDVRPHVQVHRGRHGHYLP